MKNIPIQRPVSSQTSLPLRIAFAALGLLSAGLGILGIFLPGLPTTIFLIIASYLLTRSCPWMEEKIMAMPIVKPFLPYVKGGRAMPRKARITALAMMWTCVGISLTMLFLKGAVPFWVLGVIVLAAIIGTFFICRTGRTN